jgi:hypothetical protein
MAVKSKESRQRLNCADDAPELNAEWAAEADLHRGERAVRRGRPVGKGNKAQTTGHIANDVLACLKGRGAGS